jgi:hypothetical protein
MNDKDTAWIAGLIALAMVVTYCGLTIMELYVPVPASNKESFNALVTALVGMVNSIIGYLFGRAHEAAKNAARANELMAASTPAVTPSVADTANTAKKS